ncbi:hypothetical protein C8F01DRAFT_1087154 [Mycena amicta]|nr:hypothetical protein C8F01DRAFT_1087154 [Mycena amicta]
MSTQRSNSHQSSSSSSRRRSGSSSSSSPTRRDRTPDRSPSPPRVTGKRKSAPIGSSAAPSCCLLRGPRHHSSRWQGAREEPVKDIEAMFEDEDWSQEDMDEFLDKKRADERNYEAYRILHRILPSLAEKRARLDADELKDWLQLVTKGANVARSEDFRKLSSHVADWINHDMDRNVADICSFDHTQPATETNADGEQVVVRKHAPYLVPDDRGGRGAAHDITGGLLSSTDVTRNDIRAKRASLAPNYWARLFYAGFKGDKDNVEAGYLQSRYLVKAANVILFASDEVVDNEDAENEPPRKKRKSTKVVRKAVAELSGLNGKMTGRVIAYVAVVLYASLLPISQWQDIHNDISLPQFYDFIVDFFEEPAAGSEARKRVDTLLSWWNQSILIHWNAADVAHAPYLFLRVLGAHCLGGLDKASVSGGVSECDDTGKRAVRDVVTGWGIGRWDGSGKQGRDSEEGTATASYCTLTLRAHPCLRAHPTSATPLHNPALFVVTHEPASPLPSGVFLAIASPSPSLSAPSNPFTLCYLRILRRRPFGGCATVKRRERILREVRAWCGPRRSLDGLECPSVFAACVSGHGWQMPGPMHIRMWITSGAGEKRGERVAGMGLLNGIADDIPIRSWPLGAAFDAVRSAASSDLCPARPLTRTRLNASSEHSDRATRYSRYTSETRDGMGNGIAGSRDSFSQNVGRIISKSSRKHPHLPRDNNVRIHPRSSHKTLSRLWSFIAPSEVPEHQAVTEGVAAESLHRASGQAGNRQAVRDDVSAGEWR